METGSKELHQEILRAAAPFLKRNGIEGAPVDEIMKAAGLTSGALYSRFKNKEDLCTQVICTALDAALDSYRKIVSERGKEGLKTIIAGYLSTAHASDVSRGCTLAALGAEMGKGGARAKRAYEPRIHTLVQILADGLGAGAEADRRAKAQHIFSTMLGAVTLARAMDDGNAGENLLSQVRSQVLRDVEAWKG